MSTIVHLLLAVVLTSFLAVQVASLLCVVRCRRDRIALRAARRTDLVWTAIPVVIVLFLAARSWVAAFDLERPAAASAVSQVEPGAPPGGAPR